MWYHPKLLDEGSISGHWLLGSSCCCQRQQAAVAGSSCTTLVPTRSYMIQSHQKIDCESHAALCALEARQISWGCYPGCSRWHNGKIVQQMAKGLHSVIFIAFLTEVFLYLLLCCGPVVLCNVSSRMKDEKKKSCSGDFNDFRFAWTLGPWHSSFSQSGLSPCCKPKCVARQCQVRFFWIPASVQLKSSWHKHEVFAIVDDFVFTTYKVLNVIITMFFVVPSDDWPVSWKSWCVSLFLSLFECCF